MNTVVCLKWGDLYSHEYVNRLYRGVARNLSGEFRFVCFTEKPEGILPEADVRDIDLLAFGKIPARSVWLKLSLMHPDAGLEGTCLFIDLDVVIWDSLDDFFTHPGEFCIVRNWIERRKRILRARPMIGNSSVFRFKAGAHPESVEKYSADPEAARRDYPSKQAFLTAAVDGGPRFWPEEWVRSYKRHCLPIFPMNWVCRPRVPPRTRILAFHGLPKPGEAAAGYRVSWHKRALPCPEIGERWLRE